MSNFKRKLLSAALAQDFNMFLEKCYNEIDGGEKYTETIATELIIDKLNYVSNGNTKRLIINVPPRTLKTTIVSIAYTAWLLGHNPTLKILCISYGDDLAKDFSFKTKQIMRSKWYKEAFPKTRLKQNRQQDDFFETTRNGFRKAASLGGTLTGYGADIIIIDDPQKSQDICSEKTRKSSNEIFSNTIISRLNNKNEGKIIVVAQRLHPDDFSNYVQKFGKWDVLSIPAIEESDKSYTLSDGSIINRKTDDVINSELEPLEKLKEIKSGMGEFNFSAQYQQMPIPPQGNIIKYKDFAFYDILPPSEKIYIQSWDVAAKTGENNDYSVCVTAAVCNNIVYIVDILRYKLDFPDLLNKVKEMYKIYNAQRVIIENSSIGPALISHLRKELVIIPYNPTESKADRAITKTYLIRSRNVLLPKNAHWLEHFKDEIQSFPYGKHDDQVDAFTQLLDEIEKERQSPTLKNMAEAINTQKQKEWEESQHPEQLKNFMDMIIKNYKKRPRGWIPPRW
ncbi:MAG: phage terminase large subunit [Candidatus Gastranaerophilales bacterium]|nr:phage terminase large subunit [Candidatus Gastranaerophilales bacterium]